MVPPNWMGKLTKAIQAALLTTNQTVKSVAESSAPIYYYGVMVDTNKNKQCVVFPVISKHANHCLDFVFT